MFMRIHITIIRVRADFLAPGIGSRAKALWGLQGAKPVWTWKVFNIIRPVYALNINK